LLAVIRKAGSTNSCRGTSLRQAETRWATDGAYGHDNLSGVFWRLSRCDVFTEETRAKYLEISKMVAENLEIEGQAADEALEKVRKNLAPYIGK
jgi:hypothetical protein